VGVSAAVLPEQLAVWSYPLTNSDADQASFNMVTAMMCRIHQSGHLDSLSPQAWPQVSEGIRIYKDILRKSLSNAIPFYPLGIPDVTDSQKPVALGMRSQSRTLLAVWRIDAPAKTEVPWTMPNPTVLYPVDLGVKITTSNGSLNVEFPRTRMACLISG
jgi:alpha-galactosidase